MDIAKLGVKVDPDQGVKALGRIDKALDNVGAAAEQNLRKLDRESTKAQKSLSRSGKQASRGSRGFQDMTNSALALADGTGLMENRFGRLVNRSRSMLGGLRGLTGGAGAAGGAMKGAAGGAGLLAVKLGAVIAIAAGVVAAIAAVAGAAAGLFAMFKKGNPMAAAFEDSRLQLAFMMGDLDKAEKRLRGLIEFSNETPFSPADTIGSNKMLFAAGGDALATNENLKLIGSAALIAERPLAEVTSTFGRLYASLKTGKPDGEALRRLMVELPILSQNSVQKLKAMAKAGADVGSMWKVVTDDLAQYQDYLKAASGTWSGLISTIKGKWDNLLREFAQPINDALKPLLKDLIALIDFLLPYAKQLGQAIANAIKALYQIAKDDGLAGLLEFVELGLKVAAIKFGRFLLVYGVAAARTLQAAMAEALIEAAIKFGKNLIGQVTAPLKMLEKGIQKTSEVLKDPSKLTATAGKRLFAFLNPGVAAQIGDKQPTHKIGDGKVDIGAIFADALKDSRGVAGALGLDQETSLEKQFSKRFGDAVNRFNELNPSDNFTVPDPRGGGGGGGTQDPSKTGAAKSARQIKQQRSQTEQLLEAWGNVDAQLDNLAAGSLQSVADGISRAIEGLASGALTAEEAFKQMAQSIIADITSMIIKMTVQLAIQKAINAASGNYAGNAAAATFTQGMSAGVAHAGGNIASVGQRQVDAGAFANAPRYHGGGLASSEQPAVLEKGEAILSRSDRKEMERRLQADDMGEGQQQRQEVKIINVIDPSEVQREIASNPNVIINAIARNKRQVRAVLQ